MKSFKAYIKEKIETFVVDPESGWGGGQSTVKGIENPTSEDELLSFINRTKFKDAKLIYIPKEKRTIVFDAQGVVHDELARGEGYRIGDYIRGDVSHVKGVGWLIQVEKHTQMAAQLGKSSKAIKKILSYEDTEVVEY